MLLGHTLTDSAPVEISQRDLSRHLYALGMTGTGKTSLLVNIALQQAATGDGLAFIDPHGDACHAILDRLPAGAPVIYIDPSDPTHAVGFNPLDCHDETHRTAVADNTTAAFKHAFPDSWGPRLEWLLLMACRTLLETQGPTLLGIPRLFLDEAYRKRSLKHVTDPITRFFWEYEYPSYSERLLSDALSPIFNKVGRALAAPEIRDIVCQSEPRKNINIREVMDCGQILIVNLSKGRLGEGNASLLGALLVSAISQAALSRADTSENQRRPFHLVVDEFQNFATNSFATILSEARKYKLVLTLAHQYREQVSEDLQKAAMANCANFIALRLGADDAPKIAEHLGWHEPQAFLDMADYRAIGRFLHSGQPTDPVPIALPDLPPITTSHREQILARSQNERSRPRSLIEQKIERFLLRDGAGGTAKAPRKRKRSWRAAED